MIKKYKFFIVLLISNQYLSSNNPSENQNQPPVVVNLSIHNDGSQTQKSSHKSKVSTKTQIRTNQPDLIKQMHDIYQEQLKAIKNNTHQTFDWIQTHKIISASLFCSGIYGYLFYQIYTANQIINDSNAWCNWKYNRTLDDLFAIPQKQLESEILFAVQNRYLHKENPTDFIYSMVQVLQAIQEETSILQNQINRYDTILKCYCKKIFFITEQNLIDLQEKQRKLSFIKHILTSWCASYKIDKNKI